MKITFETDDKIEINQLVKAGDMAQAIWRISQIYFEMDKSAYSSTQIKAIKDFTQEVNSILNEKGINLKELTE